MQQLSDTLEAMKLREATPKDAQRGLTTIDGPTTIQILPNLRSMAKQMEHGIPLDDKALQALLLQHFGSSRLTINEKIKHLYSDDGYDCVSDGFDIVLDRLNDDEMSLFEAFEFFNARADKNFVARHVGMLRISLARRNETEDDISLLIGVYADILEGFPKDIISNITKEWIANKKWFPLASELREACEKAVRFRQTVLKSLEIARNPVMAEQKKLSSDPRLQMHWKQLSKMDWMDQHYDWAIGETEGMLRLAEQNPTIMDVKLWQAKVDELKAHRLEKFGGAVNSNGGGATHAPAW